MLDLAMLGGPFATVLDVGGNVGAFAKQAYMRWPAARIISFEPFDDLAAANRGLAQGRWSVSATAIGAYDGHAAIWRNEFYSEASTMKPPGTVRRDLLGIQDRWREVTVRVTRLDNLGPLEPPLLLKIDVEGSEGDVLAGATNTIKLCDTVVVEVQNDPHIFAGSPSVAQLDDLLRPAGLELVGVAGHYCDPRTGRLLQWDGVWARR
jgi:FkbM family methyltransferase